MKKLLAFPMGGTLAEVFRFALFWGVIIPATVGGLVVTMERSAHAGQLEAAAEAFKTELRAMNADCEAHGGTSLYTHPEHPLARDPDLLTVTLNYFLKQTKDLESGTLAHQFTACIMTADTFVSYGVWIPKDSLKVCKSIGKHAIECKPITSN